MLWAAVKLESDHRTSEECDERSRGRCVRKIKKDLLTVQVTVSLGFSEETPE